MTRLAVVGAGLIGSRHIRAVQQNPDCTLVAVVEPDAARTAGLDVPVYARIEDVQEAADGAIIASPTPLHPDHVRAAAARGWGVLIEKPVADSLAEADALIATVKGARVASLVGHHRRHHQSVALLRRIVTEGRIGQPVLATLIWAMKKPDAYFEGNWRSGGGGSPVMINLVHDIDLLRFLFGEVTEVAAVGGAPVRDADRVESGAVALSFAGGVSATLAFADTTPSPWGFEAGTGENPNIARSGQNMLWIAGTEGGVAFPSLHVWSGAADWSETPVNAREGAPATDPLAAQLRHFLDVITGRAEPLIDAEDARKTLAVALQIETALARAREAA
ncbi:MAG: Gfo/Idh/MocA family oxidoreductase [Rhodobacter sp.]|nr:Gfo/Idh/MocA family oxidoreductase [Rhodobacter sp.]